MSDVQGRSGAPEFVKDIFVVTKRRMIFALASEVIEPREGVVRLCRQDTSTVGAPVDR